VKLLSERNQVRSVAERWLRQYKRWYRGHGYVWYDWPGDPGRGERIHEGLLALDVETATAADVDAVIGFAKGWVAPESCYECGDRSWDVVQLGEEPEYESHTAYICGSCLRKALGLVSGDGGEAG
jgi:hypothetical protein